MVSLTKLKSKRQVKKDTNTRTNTEDKKYFTYPITKVYTFSCMLSLVRFPRL